MHPRPKQVAHLRGNWRTDRIGSDLYATAPPRVGMRRLLPRLALRRRAKRPLPPHPSGNAYNAKLRCRAGGGISGDLLIEHNVQGAAACENEPIDRRMRWIVAEMMHNLKHNFLKRRLRSEQRTPCPGRQ